MAAKKHAKKTAGPKVHVHGYKVDPYTRAKPKHHSKKK